MQTIYLDHNATTPIAPEVAEAIARCWSDGHANPASQHRPGQQARRVLEDAREGVAAILGADLTCPQPDRLIFTSGGTEANNLALRGIGQARGGPGPGQVVISAIEHACIIKTAEYLLDQGWRLDTLGVTSQGVVRTEPLTGLLSDRTRVVSVQMGNHETGVLQPVAELATICSQAGVPLHTDAIQVAGKLPVDFRGLGVAALSVAAHKLRGPTGVGALILRHDVPIQPVLHGAAHQEGLRPGTESVALAVGMWTALQLWEREQAALAQRMTALRDRFEAGIRSGCPESIVHGLGAPRLPQTSNIAFPGIDGQILFTALDTVGVACSIGSACDSGSVEPSPTLLAMDVAPALVRSSLRFSLGATTTEAEVDEAVRRILEVVGELAG